MEFLKKYVLGPRLYRIFQIDQNTGKKMLARDYYTNNAEWLGESYINAVSYAIAAVYCLAPCVAYLVYQKGIFSSPDQCMYYVKVCVAACMGLSAAYILRGIGRYSNPDFNAFVSILHEAKLDKTKQHKLQLFDFEFKHWPVGFIQNGTSCPKTTNLRFNDVDDKHKNGSWLLSMPRDFLEYMLGHGLARPMTFPGSVKLLQAAMAPALLEGRTNLIEKNGVRAKLKTSDGNEIDTMFVDKRGMEAVNGDILVICCEGNAAYYEVGCMGTPLKGRYSVLGWNHPGFMGSTGLPSPSSEQNAIDAVLCYAITQLNFQQSDIVLFAWSIGGYAASYAAMLYPDVRGVVLDATFDDISVLAKARMPSFASGIVDGVIKNYMDLDNAKHLLKYPGPIRLIRRLREEIITTIPNVPATNRCNFLLERILSFRYPRLATEDSLDTLRLLLAADSRIEQDTIIESVGELASVEYLLSLKEKPVYPLDIGADWTDVYKKKAFIFLFTQYMNNFDGTHCMPLPSSYFLLPWQHPII